ncbi:MAG: hypothetical protein ACM35H_14495, partial [Bacteroidota bacterium]
MSLATAFTARRQPTSAEAEAVQAEARRMAAAVASPPETLIIPVGRIMALLATAVTLVIALSLVQDLLIFLAPELGFTDRVWRLDLDTEVSLPTWLSSGLMLICALALLALGMQARREGLRKALPWLLLSAAFFFVSLDESISLHEFMSAVIGAQVDKGGLFYFVWTVPALIACVIGLACFLPFILGFKGLDRALLLGSAVVFLSGAIGLEMIGGSVAEVAGIDNLRYRLLATAEESLEFAGLLLFLLFLLRRLRALKGGLTLRVE